MTDADCTEEVVELVGLFGFEQFFESGVEAVGGFAIGAVEITIKELLAVDCFVEGSLKTVVEGSDVLELAFALCEDFLEAHFCFVDFEGGISFEGFEFGSVEEEIPAQLQVLVLLHVVVHSQVFQVPVQQNYVVLYQVVCEHVALAAADLEFNQFDLIHNVPKKHDFLLLQPQYLLLLREILLLVRNADR